MCLITGFRLSPHARRRPTQPVTLNGGMKMPSWFDILTLNSNDVEDTPSIHRAAAQVQTWIKEECETSGLPSERILLGGFSQGGGLALYASLTSASKLAGVVAMSCWLPLHAEFPGALKEANKSTRFFHGHGDSDAIVSHKGGKETSDFVKGLGVSGYEFKTYANMAHSSCAKEMHDVKNFITSITKEAK